MPLPVSGVANCHVLGLYSFIINDDLRVFATTDWTTLSSNIRGEALGFHDHHRDISIKVLTGQILNVQPEMNRGNPCPEFKKWRWDSKLRGGAGDFAKASPSVEFVSNRTLIEELSARTPPAFLRHEDFHSVVQLSKRAVWVVREHGASTLAETTTWSREDLSKWSSRDMYQPLPPESIRKVWSSVAPS